MTDNPAYGTADHARMVTFGRHPDIQTAMAWLAFSHLPDKLKSLCSPIYGVACALLQRIPNDSAELKTALNRLVEAKDWFVRAGIRSDEGVPGPVPRPATVADPPGRVQPTVDGIRGHMVFTPEEDEARRAMALNTPTDWPQIARDLISGDPARVDKRLPPPACPGDFSCRPEIPCEAEKHWWNQPRPRIAPTTPSTPRLSRECRDGIGHVGGCDCGTLAAAATRPIQDRPQA